MMRISNIVIRNLRSFRSEEIPVNAYTCLIGPNGSGKSTILCSLNIFFRETENSSTDTTKLEREDFHQKDITNPIEVTVTFSDLSPEAQNDFKDYYRNGKLIITARAEFNPETQRADVKQYGNRLGMEAFADFFRLHGDNALVARLREVYSDLRRSYPGLPAATQKDAMFSAIREYESARPAECKLIPSSDQFYGFSRAGDKLAKYVQWVYVPATKDASSEQLEARNTAIGRLLAQTVNARSAFADSVKALREKIRGDYQQILNDNQSILDDISATLQARLSEWAHSGAVLNFSWRQDPEKSVRVEEPLAQVQVGEGEFIGELARLGHGLQRSYIIALLHELAKVDNHSGPTLVLGCEEPELYQHPPQARHLSHVLSTLAGNGSQVIVSTHSPYFVSSETFEDIRLVRKSSTSSTSRVKFASYEEVSALLTGALDQQSLGRNGVQAKIHQVLQSHVSEMFFASRVVFVESIEDSAYIQTYLSILGLWDVFRRNGCHIIPVGKKSEIPRPLAIAKKLSIPTLVVFDSDATKLARMEDGPKKERETQQHLRDNRAILRLCGDPHADPMPRGNVWGNDYVMWHHNIGRIVQDEIGSDVWISCRNEASQLYDHAGDLDKNPLHIGASLLSAHQRGAYSESLRRLINCVVHGRPDIEVENTVSAAST